MICFFDIINALDAVNGNEVLKCIEKYLLVAGVIWVVKQN